MKARRECYQCHLQLVACEFCREPYCANCGDHNEDRCAREEYDHEREQAIRDVEDKWGMR